MVDFTSLENLIDEEDNLLLVNNMYDIFGELYNGENLRIVLSDTEREIKEEFKVVLPKGYGEYEKMAINTNAKTFNFVLNMFIFLLTQLNPQRNEDKKIYELKIAIIAVVCLSGTITTEKNFKVSDIEFNADYIRENKKKVKKGDSELIKEIISAFPAANNFLAFSTFNYIRFNHHFPAEKVHLIKKAILSLGETIIDEILEEENKNTFYNFLVAPSRINNEIIYYEKFLNKDLEKLHNGKFKYYSILGNIHPEMKDEIIKIRAWNTPNGFLILDLLKEMVLEINSKKLLFALPYVNEIKRLLEIRCIIRKNPFSFHPARYFFKVASEDYDNIRSEFLNLMETVGGLLYMYTENMQETIAQAKCRIKYANKVKLSDSNIVKFIMKVANKNVEYSEEDIATIKEKLNTTDVAINKDSNLEEMSNKVLSQFANLLN